MFRPVIATLSAALLASAPLPAAQAEVPDQVQWSLEPAADAEAGQTQFSISYRDGRSSSNWSSTTDLSELEGLDPALANGPASFRIVREAGRFDCEGAIRARRGSGTCRFAADPAFAAGLARHGIAAPTRQESYSLALARVSIALVDALDREGYQRPDAGDLVGAGIHGADAPYVRAMAQAGYRVGTVNGLVAMRIHGVTSDFVEALAAAGYRPDADMAVQLRIHGATPDYIRALGAAGGTGYSTEDLVSMRIHGVTPDFLADLRGLGYDRIAAGELTTLRIHGIDPAFIRRSNDAAGRRLAPGELVSRRLNPDMRLGSR